MNVTMQKYKQAAILTLAGILGGSAFVVAAPAPRPTPAPMVTICYFGRTVQYREPQASSKVAESPSNSYGACAVENPVTPG